MKTEVVLSDSLIFLSFRRKPKQYTATELPVRKIGHETHTHTHTQTLMAHTHTNPNDTHTHTRMIETHRHTLMTHTHTHTHTLIIQRHTQKFDNKFVELYMQKFVQF